jgi:hypothetical protein
MFEFSIIALLTPLFSLLMIFRSFSLFRKRKQSWREFLLWVVLWSGIGVIAYWPELLDYLPPYIGIKSGVNVLIFFGFVVLFYGFFRLFLKVEDLERKFVELNRGIALKEHKEFNEYKEHKDLKGGGSMMNKGQ